MSTNFDKPWDYKNLGKNKNITWNIVVANLDRPWDYASLGQNPNITWDIIIGNPDKPWDYEFVSKNPNINWNIVETNQDIRWSYPGLSENKMMRDPYFNYSINNNNMTSQTHETQEKSTDNESDITYLRGGRRNKRTCKRRTLSNRKKRKFKKTHKRSHRKKN